MRGSDRVDDLYWMSATELARLMRTGELSAVEVLDAHLKRIQAVNPTLNAIVTLTEDQARADAAAADARHAAGEDLGLLHGLPIAHKDLADTAGVRTTGGSPLYVDRIPTADALVVERAKSAGAISIGKSNTPEFGAGSQTFNEVFGATANPYDTGRTCGGSSGGAAVALASGMVPLADGSDMGGSLRNPASFCNVVGLRPSPGRVPAWPKSDAWSHLSTEGPMGRTVDDVALLLAAQAGPDPRSPIALETPGADFVPPVGTPDHGLRIAWAPDLGGLPIDPAVRTALAGVPGTFEALGHHVAEAAPDLSDAREVFSTLRAWSFALGLSGEFERHHDALKETVIWNVELGRTMPMLDHQRAWRLREQLYQRTVAFFNVYDILLCPVAQVPPFPLDVEYPTEIDGEVFETYIDWMRVCTDVTVMNVPALSMPAGFTDAGLPIGVQIVGPPRRDDLVLSVARQFESVNDAGTRRPPL
ncbi:MAG: amidase [Actinomycetota bacterium]